jgi:ribose/xylose/arabinose/galactoside ABC-type transport system permease subunit
LAREIAFGEGRGRSRFLAYVEHTREYLGRSPESGAIFGVLSVLIFFIIATWRGSSALPLILTPDSIASIFTQAAAQGIIAVGVAILMISGEFDLSVGSILGLSALIFIQASSSGLSGLAQMVFSSSRVQAWGLSSAGFPGLLAIACALAAGVLLGLINGLLLVSTRIPSFIVTLGTLYIYRSIMLNIIPGGTIARYLREPDIWSFNPVLIILLIIVGVGSLIFFLWPSLRHSWWQLRENNRHKLGPMFRLTRVVAAMALIVVVAALIIIGYASDAQHGTLIKAKFFDILNGKLSFTRYQFRSAIIWWFLIAAVFSIILNRTRFGNAVFAAGGNPQAARAQGVNVNRVKVLNFVLSGTLAAVGGIMEGARFTVVEPTRGTGYELDVIAAVVIGGTLLTGGYGSVWGAVLGVLITFMLKTGLVLINVPAEWYRGVLGMIMIGAVIINTNIRRQR